MRVLKLRVENLLIVGSGFNDMIKALIFFVMLPVAASASPTGRATIDLVFELGESRMALAEYIMRGAADYLIENPDPGSSEGHSAFKRILNGSTYFRSILAIDENGQLMFDSYNWIPFLGAKDLSQRSYFLGATNAVGKVLRVGDPVVGKQSGQVFLPFTMAVPNGSGRGQRVVMMTVPPKTMLPSFEVCNFCGVIIALDGKVLVADKPMSDVNEAVISRLTFEGEYGAQELDLRGMTVETHWRKSSRYGVVYLYYRATPLTDG
ncbi:hypothetical protein IT775_12240 [Thalassobius aquimarinus]|uniref:Cache domain protein n=2 Tax=Thalassovita aquimarina TaxID=2785917 RepID=A0ABS5HSJ4_9RHOB|nr:hypothetical protein [Thalassovita aquimarina]